MPKIKNVFKWVNWEEKVIYWESKILFDYWDWTNSEWTVWPNWTQWTVTKYTDRVTFYNGSWSSSNYLSQYPIDCTKDFLLEFRWYIPNTSASYHTINLANTSNKNISFNTRWETQWTMFINIDGNWITSVWSNPWTADYFIKKEWTTLTMWWGGDTKYTTTYTFPSEFYLSEGVYRDTLTIYTAKLTYL